MTVPDDEPRSMLVVQGRELSLFWIQPSVLILVGVLGTAILAARGAVPWIKGMHAWPTGIHVALIIGVVLLVTWIHRVVERRRLKSEGTVEFLRDGLHFRKNAHVRVVRWTEIARFDDASAGWVLIVLADGTAPPELSIPTLSEYNRTAVLGILVGRGVPRLERQDEN